MQFAAPATQGGLDKDAAKGHLLLVEVLAIEKAVPTPYGEVDAVRTNVIDLDDENLSVDDALIFGALANGLRTRIGQYVLGVLGQGQAKPGQSPPWRLEDASTDAKAVKRAQAALKARGPQTAAPAASTDIPF